VKFALADANREYERRFNRIFIVCATGKSASEILEIVHRRLYNDAETELHEAAEQQRQITEIRLRNGFKDETHFKLISWISLGASLPGRARATAKTDHVRRLAMLTSARTVRMAAALSCCRKARISAGEFYRLIFDVASYHAAQSIDALYPVVAVTFHARAGESHFHIPLLLSPNGYTTYRGS